MRSKRSVYAAVRSRRRQPQRPGAHMEVHAPEHAIHTRRQFLIHMLAITLGLLIALGLDKPWRRCTAATLRHQLEENIRAEAGRNSDILTTHLDVNIPNMLWDRAALKAVRAARPNGGLVDITLPPPDPNESNTPMTAPERIVFPVAESTGALALLPESEAQAYATLDFMAQEDAKQVDAIREANALVDRFRLATGTRLDPGEQLHLTLAERDQLIAALSAYSQTLYALLRRDNLFLNVCQAIAKGVRDVNSLEEWQQTHPLRINQYRN